MVRTQIQLTEDQARKLKEMASERGVSVAELVREGVSDLIKDSGRVDATERINRAMQIAGKFRSRKSDISNKHDRYLADAYK